MSEPIVGIDLGTTNSVVAYTDPAGITHVIPDESGSRLTPSVVYFPHDGSIVVGESAREHALIEPDRVASLFKRDMGLTRNAQDRPFVIDDRYWSPEELSAMVLKKLAGIAGRWLSVEVAKAVITVPYYFGEPERAATRAAGEIAGLEVVRIINEPTAAAIAHGLDEDGQGRLMVFDLGGGTLDVTVMGREDDDTLVVAAGSGDRELGGADFDAAILDDMREVLSSEIGGATLAGVELADMATRARTLKHMLSNAESHSTPLSAQGRSTVYELTRERFERELLSSSAQQVEDVLHGALEKADVAASPLATALMVGGSSRIPFFQSMVERVTGLTPRLSRNLDEDVARGASMLAARLRGDLDPRSALAQIPEPVDAASHALGIKLRNADTLEYYNEVLIPEGTAIPHTATHTFYAIRDGQTRLAVTLNEGPEEDLDLVRPLQVADGAIGRAVPQGHPFRYEIQYTIEQLVIIEVYDQENNRFVTRLEYDDAGTVDVAAAREAAMDLEVG